MIFQDLAETVIIDAPMVVKIERSKSLSCEEKRAFTNMLSYFTPEELEELTTLL